MVKSLQEQNMSGLRKQLTKQELIWSDFKGSFWTPKITANQPHQSMTPQITHLNYFC